MTLRPATYVYANYGLPRSQLRELADAGVIHSEERLSIDGVNMMRLYDCDAIERYLNGDAAAPDTADTTTTARANEL